MLINEVSRYDDLFIEGYSSITLIRIDYIYCFTRRVINNKYTAYGQTITFNMKTDVFKKGITSIEFFKQLVNQTQDIQAQFAYKPTELTIEGYTKDEIYHKICELIKISDSEIIKYNVPTYNK